MSRDDIQVTIYMSREERDRIDEARGFQSRSQWIVAACRTELERTERRTRRVAEEQG